MSQASDPIVSAWITFQYLQEDSPEYEKLQWSFGTVWELCHENPDAALDFILAVMDTDFSPTIQATLSAGPLEDLLVKHGDQVIAKVEALAGGNAKFATLLGGVWKNSMTDTIWQRVNAIADRRGWDDMPE